MEHRLSLGKITYKFILIEIFDVCCNDEILEFLFKLSKISRQFLNLNKSYIMRRIDMKLKDISECLKDNRPLPLKYTSRLYSQEKYLSFDIANF
jgi:hypothetical protein